ncbi:MAG: DUF1636 domain-containing protein [Paracoccaceae bacterium]|jgi:predicted metal-binding protein
MTTIIVCDTCDYSLLDKLHNGKTGGEILAEHVERIAASTAITVRRQSCLMGCERHCNIAIQGDGKLTYVLGKFNPTAESAEAVVEYAERHAESETGQVPFKQWPQGVKGHFVARIPSLT